jgi:hypothetical protein
VVAFNLPRGIYLAGDIKSTRGNEVAGDRQELRIFYCDPTLLANWELADAMVLVFFCAEMM